MAVKRKGGKVQQEFPRVTEIFSPFVLYVDGILGNEALVVLANLSRIMASKIEEPILHVHGWANGRIGIVVVRSYSFMICRARPESPLRDRVPIQELGSGHGLA